MPSFKPDISALTSPFSTEFPTRTTNATGRPPPRPPYRQMVSTLHGLNPAHMYTLPADHTPNHAIKPPRHPHRILSLDDLCPPEEESFESHFPRDLKTPSSTLTTPSSDSFLSSATERRPTISDGQVGSGNPNLFGTSASNGITNPINRRPSHSGILPRSIATPEMALDFPSSRRKFSVGRGGR